MDNKSWKGWLYLLPAMLFLGFFMVYPLIDVFVYSFEEGYNSASQTYFGVGLYNYRMCCKTLTSCRHSKIRSYS